MSVGDHRMDKKRVKHLRIAKGLHTSVNDPSLHLE